MGPNQWTGKLHEIALKTTRVTSGTPLSGSTAFPTVIMYGPYGKLNINIKENKMIVMVAGGIGITPFLSIYEGYTHYFYIYFSLLK